MLTKYLSFGALLILLNPGSIFIFLLFTFLVNIYRLTVIFFAKWLRPDLGVCMSGTTNSMLVNDWFSKNPPRSTIVVTIYYKTTHTRKWAEEQVLRRWITAKRENNGEPKYPQFLQYPYRWFGYTFWKNDEYFNIKNHIFANSRTEVGEKELNELTEKLLNQPYSRNRSPWEIHILENYKTEKFHGNVSSVLVLKVHHCLADGYSILAALIEGLSETSMSGLVLPKPRHAQKTSFQKVLFILTFPFVFCYELFGIYKYAFEYSPWKIKDSQKKWHMICSQSELIPIQNLKEIKNKIGVSFTSVLISAISAGITKINSGRINDGKNVKTLCLSTLPLGLGNRKDKLTNQMTAAVFPLPTGNNYTSSLERLKSCNELLESIRNSIVPHGVSIYMSVLGSLFTKAAAFLGINRLISVGLTNFPTLPPNREGTGIEDAVFAEFTIGGLEGVCGLVFIVVSCPPYIRIGVSAEQAVLSRTEADYLVKAVEKEINTLYSLSTGKLNQR